MNARVKKPKLSLGTILLYLAAAFQATQFARAFHALDATSAWAQAGGLLAGVVVNVGLAYSASRLPRIRSPKARRFAYSAFIILIVMTPIFLAPINFITMGTLWSNVVWLKWTLAIIGASAVDVTISLVAFADGSLMPSLSDAQRVASDAGSDVQRRSAIKIAKTSVAGTKIYRCECGQTFANRFEYSGHARTCATRKEIKAGSNLIPVQMPASMVRSAKPQAKAEKTK